jgi:hypothetical protein
LSIFAWPVRERGETKKISLIKYTMHLVPLFFFCTISI